MGCCDCVFAAEGAEAPKADDPPPNRLFLNCGRPVAVGFRVLPITLPVVEEGNPLPNGLPVVVGERENIVARKGFAAPAMPVA